MFFHWKIMTTVNISQYVLKTWHNIYSRYFGTMKAMESDIIENGSNVSYSILMLLMCKQMYLYAQ
jgi:hypothetical protein